MATRNGKITNLPNDIRELLNLRLLDGEPSRELAAWLNALPEVQSVLSSQFNDSPISEVNLTFWRQGGYLQWLTERECFDSARALADGDCDLAKTGLSAERLLNMLTLRFGQLLMRWDFSPDEGVSQTAAFSVTAKKARILQGISRSVLAIHRIQSRSPDKKSQPSTTPATSRSNSEGHASPSPATAECVTLDTKETRTATENPTPNPFRAPHGPGDCHPRILSAPILRQNPPLHLPRTLFKAELDLNEFLKAV
jgi:hypothetical protein